MSKKSAYRRRKPRPTAYAFTPHTWNHIRAHLGWPETGEPVPYAACVQLREDLEREGEGVLLTLMVLVTEGWRLSYPEPPRQVLLVP
jgi:hypothetical protein